MTFFFTQTVQTPSHKQYKPEYKRLAAIFFGRPQDLSPSLDSERPHKRRQALTETVNHSLQA